MSVAWLSAWLLIYYSHEFDSFACSIFLSLKPGFWSHHKHHILSHISLNYVSSYIADNVFTVRYFFWGTKLSVIMKVHHQGLANGMTLSCLMKIWIIATRLSVVSSKGMGVITDPCPKKSGDCHLDTKGRLHSHIFLR